MLCYRGMYLQGVVDALCEPMVVTVEGTLDDARVLRVLPMQSQKVPAVDRCEDPVESGCIRGHIVVGDAVIGPAAL
jgi:hypothetical protein